MEFIEAIQKGDPNIFLSKISKINEKPKYRFQEIVRDLELKFEELRNLECFIDIDEPKKNVREPKRKRAAGAEVSKLSPNAPNDSVCTSNLNEPLGSSTPTDALSIASTNKENYQKEPSGISENSDVIPKTPPNEVKCPMQTESVKKRIEEFEKRAAAAASPSSKIPVLTPMKKPFIIPTVSKNTTTKPVRETRAKPQIYIEKPKDAPIVKPRLTRNNSKILQEKNTNIKALKEPDPPAKRVIVKKASTDETRKKKEDAPQKIRVNKAADEKQKRNAATKEQQEKEKEAKIRAVHKQKEEKLLILKKKNLGTTKSVETIEKKPVQKTLESYDIEDVVDGADTDDEENPTKKIPSWATKENRKHQLSAQAWMDKKNTVYMWFYNRQLKYPKVEELFSINVKIRPRTSSAVWNNSSICI